MGSFDKFKKWFQNKEESADFTVDTIDNIELLPEDKVQIEALTHEEIDIDVQKQRVVAQLDSQKDKLESQIIAIQRSTRVALPVFAKIHNDLRQKYSWYYRWHMNPFSNLIHWSAISGFTLGLTTFIFSFIFSLSVAPIFAASEHSWGSESAWQTWTLSELSTKENSGALTLAKKSSTPTTSDTASTNQSVSTPNQSSDQNTSSSSFASSGTANIVFTPNKDEVVDWLSFKSDEVLNSQTIKKEFSTDGILYTDKIEDLADSKSLHIKVSLSTSDTNLTPILNSLTLQYSRLPNAPENLSIAVDQGILKTTQVLSANSFSDPDNDTHKASQWQVTKSSGNYSGDNLLLDQTNTNTKDKESLTKLELSTPLTEGAYYLRARYQDSTGAWSLWSKETTIAINKDSKDNANLVDKITNSTTETKVNALGDTQIQQNINELPDLRTETSKTIDNKNNTRTLESYSGIIHYKEDYTDPSNTSWKDINPSHSVDTPSYVLFDQMPSTVKVFKDKIGYEIESRKTGDKYTVQLESVDGNPKLSRSRGLGSKVAWADINTNYSSSDSEKSDSSRLSTSNNNIFTKYIFPSALAENVAADDGNLKFEFDISEYGVRLWKTIEGPDAPKNFKWNITKTNGTKDAAKDDLKFRDDPEAFTVENGIEKPEDQVKIEAKKIAGNDSSFTWQETAPSSDLKIDTDVTYYPDPNVEVSSVDGNVYTNVANQTWATARGAAGAGFSDSTTNSYVAGIGCGTSAGTYTYIYRSHYLFNTSAIPASATISAATFSVWGSTKTDTGTAIAPTINVYPSNPTSTTALASSDYAIAKFTPGTALSTAITYAGWSTAGYNNFAISSPDSNIIKAGTTKFGLLTANYDAANSAPASCSASSTHYFNGYYADYTGTANDPKLAITFTNGATVSGTAYANDETTPLTGSARTVGIRVNGGTETTTTTNTGDGTFSFSNVTVNANDVVTVYLSGATEKSAVVTTTDGVSNITGLMLADQHLSVSSDNGSTATTTANIGVWDKDNDATNLFFTGNTNVLTVDAGNELYIPTGKLYTPGGNVNADDVKILGTLSAGTYTYTVSGDWNSSGGTFTYGTSTVNFTETGTVTSTSMAHPFYNASFAAAGKTTTMGNTFFVDNVVTLGTGTLTGAYSLSLYSTNTTPLVNSGATISNGKIQYRPTATGTYNVAAGNYGSAKLELVGGVSNQTFNLAGDITTSNLLSLAAVNAITGTITNTQNRNVTVDGITFGVPTATGSHTLNLGSSTVDVGATGVCITNNGGTHTINLGAAGITNAGIWKNVDGTGALAVTPGTSTVTMDAGTTGKTITSNGQSFKNLIFNNAAGGWDFQDAASVTGDLTVTNSDTAGNGVNLNNQAITVAGNIALNGGKFTAGSGTINLGGNWTDNSVYVPGTSTLNITGTSTSTINGSNTFPNFSSSASDKTIAFASGETQTITGTTNINGTSGHNIILSRSGGTGTDQWSIDPQDTKTVSFATITDSNNISGSAINPANSTVGANNTNWVSGKSISGSVYIATDKSTNIGSGKTIGLSINGAAKTTTTTFGGGVFNFTDLTLSAGDVITIFSNDATYKANYVTNINDSGDGIDNIEMFQNQIVLSHENAGPITNSDLDTANNSGDADIFWSTATTTVNFTTTYTVKIASGKTYTPGGDVNMGGFYLFGTFSPENYTFSACNTFDATGGTLSANTATFVVKVDNSFNFTSAGLTFYRLTFNKTAGITGTVATIYNSFTVSDALTIKNDFASNLNYSILASGTPVVTVGGNLSFPSAAQTGTVTVGSTTAASNFSVYLAGNFTMSDANITSSTIVRFNHDSADQTVTKTAGTLSGDGDSGGWYVNKAAGTVTLASNISGLGGTTVTSGTLNMGSTTFSGGFYSQGGGTFTASGGSGTFTTFTISGGTFTSPSTLTVSGAFNQSGGTFNSPANFAPASTFTHSNGTFVAPSGTLTIINTFNHTNGTFTHNSGTVMFRAAAYTLTATGVTFDDVIFEGLGATTITIGSDLTISGNLTIQNNTANNYIVSGTNRVITLGGNVSIPSTASGATVSFGTGGFTLILSGNYTMSDSSVTFYSSIVFNHPSNDQTMTRTAGLTQTGEMIINKASGSVILASNITGFYTTTITSGTLDMGATTFSGGAFTQNGGTFASSGGGATFTTFDITGGTFNPPTTLSVSGAFTQSGGTFNSPTNFSPKSTFSRTNGTFVAPSGTLTIINTFTNGASGTFNTNSGTVMFKGASYTITATGLTFNNVIFEGYTTPASISLGSNFTISGDLTIQNNTGNAYSVSGATRVVTVNGNISAPSTAAAGTINFGSGATLLASGDLTLSDTNLTFQPSVTFQHASADQTVTRTAGTVSTGTWTVNKAAGSVILASDIATLGGTTITSGTLDMGATTFSGGVFNQGGGTFACSGGSATFSNFTYSNGTFNTPTTLTISGAFNQSGGNFTAPSTLSVSSSTFTLSGGTFTAPSGNLTFGSSVTISAPATFNHNNGTIIFTASNSYSITSGGKTFYNVSFAGSANGAAISLAGNMSVDGDLSISNQTANGYSIISNGTLRTVTIAGNLSTPTSAAAGTVTVGSLTVGSNVKFSVSGNVTLNDSSVTSYASIDFVHPSANQTVVRGSTTLGGDADTGIWTVNKAAGSAILASNISGLSGTTVTSGTLDIGATTFSGGAYTQNGTGTFTSTSGSATFTTFTISSGEFTYPSGGMTVSGAFTQSGGTFNSPSDFAITGTFTQSNGVFNAPTGTLTLTGTMDRTGGTFNHNNGLVKVLVHGYYFFRTAGATFYDLTFDRTDTAALTYTNNFRDSFTVEHDLVVQDPANAASTDVWITATNTPTITVNGLVSFPSNASAAIMTFGANAAASNFTIDAKGDVSILDTQVDIACNLTFSHPSADQTFTADPAITFIGDTDSGLLNINKSSGKVTLNGNMATFGSTTLTSGALDISGYNFGATSLTVNSGATFKLKGKETITLGSPTTPTLSAGSNIEFTGHGAVENIALKNYTYTGVNLKINDVNASKATFTMPAAKSFASVEIASGTLDATASNYNINASGNWTVGANGSFVKRAATVTLDGAGGTTQVISGDTSFNNLTFSSTAARAVQFAGNSTTTVTGTWTVTGASGKVITLASTDTNNWTINPTAASVTYADVARSTNTGVTFCATYTADSGNNTNWNIGPSNSCVPSAPTNVAITPTSSTGFDVTWIDNANNETGYRVFISTTPNANCSLASYPGTPDFNAAANAVTQAVGSKSVDTQYCAKVIAAHTSYGDSAAAYAAAPKYTFAAVPGTATLTAPATGKVNILIDQNGNPATVRYAIYNNTLGKYVKQVDGTTQDTEDWQTYTTWGGASGIDNISLSPNTSYSYKVKAENSESTPAVTSYSADATKYTLANVPSFTSVAGDYSDADKWHLDTVINANSNPAGTEYYIQYSTNDTDYADPNSMAWQSSTDYLFKKDSANADLAANTQYWTKVKAKNGDGVETAYSSSSADVTPVAAPTGLSESNLTSDGGMISWTAVTGADRYTVSYGTDGAASNIGTVADITETSKTFTGLNAETQYFYKVLAISDANGTGPYSVVDSFTTASTGGPTAPADFNGSAASTTAIDWTWTDGVANETGYKVEDGAHTNLSTDLAANTASWNETGLSADTAYTRHVNVWNGNGSNDSNSVTKYTLANTPAAPTVATVSSSRINVKINQNSNPATTRYAIYNETESKYVKHADGSLQVAEDWQTYADWGGANGFENIGLTKNTEYSYKVKAENGDDIATALSSVAAATTLNTYTITANTNGGNGTGSTDATSPVDAGANQDITATPAASSVFTSWTGCDSVTGNVCHLVNIAANKTVTATFTLKTYDITINTAGTGTGTLDQATQTVNYGSTVVVNATADASSDFTSWSGCTSANGAECTLSNITAIHTLTATFTLKSFNISATITSGSGTITPANTTAVNYGASQHYDITPDTGYHTTSVTIDGTPQGVLTEYDFTNVTGAHTISAIFAINTYTVTISQDGNGSGSLDQVTQDVNYGSNLTITATPAASSTVSFTGCTSVLGDVCTLTNITSIKNVTATFTLRTYTITASSGGNGSVSPSGVTTVNYGANQTITVTPDANYQIADVSVDGGSVGTPASYDFTNITQNHTISATFTDTAPIAASAASLTNLSTTGFDVAWTDNSANETGFKVFISTTANDDCSLATYPGTPDFTTAAGATSQSISGKVINTRYCAKVVATNATGDSAAAYSAPLYTLVNTPDAPTLSGPNVSIIKVTINQNSNPATATYAIYNETTGQYVQANGTLGASAVWQSYTVWGGASGLNMTGLSLDTSYAIKVKARNTDNIETSLSSASSLYTLVNVPGAPTLTTTAGTDRLKITINQNSNPSSATYAIYNETLGKYSDISGNLVDSAVWRTYTSWGGAAGQYVIGLSANTQYTFKIKARNTTNAETALSAPTAAYTAPIIPGVPTLTTTSESSIKVVVDPETNPVYTVYSIQIPSLGKFVKSDGTVSDTADWQTYANWGGENGIVLTGLSPNTNYSFRERAQNPDGFGTSYTLTVSTYTFANSPTISAAGDYSVDDGYHLDVTIGANSNPGTTTYWIQYSTDNVNFFDPYGMAWQTSTSYVFKKDSANANISANTQYYFKVKARNAISTETDYSASSDDVTPPAAPTGSSASNICSATALTSWNASVGANKYTVSYGTDVNATNISSVGDIVTTSYTISGLSNATTYYWKVNAVSDANGAGAHSSITSFSTSVCSGPAAPSDFTGIAASTTQIDWGWSDSSSSETGYRVENAAHTNLSTDLAAGTTTWSEGSLSANTAYTRVVNIFDTNGSNDSNQATVYTYANVPGAPVLSAIGSRSIRITINQNSNPVNTRYAIYNETATKYVKHADGSLQDTPDWQLYSAWGSGSGFVNNTLTPNTEYTYKVKAQNGDNVETALSASSNASSYPTYAVSIITDGNGAGSLNQASQDADHGSNLTVIATPAISSTVTFAGCDSVTGNTCNLTSITAAKNVTATFTLKTFAVTVNKVGTGTLDQATQTVNYGSSLTVNATPDASTNFTGWSGDASGTGAAVLNNITATKTITATFTIKTFAINAFRSGCGSISPATQTVNYDASSAAITFTPDAGCYISDVLVDSGSVGTPSSYTFNNVTAAHSVNVTFVAYPTATFTINAGAAKTNSASVSLNISANAVTTEMKVSLLPDLAGASYEPIAATKAFNLDAPSTDGMKTIYMMVKDAINNESAIISDTITLDTTATAAPTNLVATAGQTSVSLAWTNPVDSDFAKVAIFRSTTANFTADLGTNKIGNTTSRDAQTYIDTNVVNGTTYYYQVKAIDDTDNYSIASNEASAKPDSDLPTTPGALTISNKSNTKDGIEYAKTKDITLAFTPSTDTNSGLKSYLLSIGTTSNGGEIVKDSEILVSSLADPVLPSTIYPLLSDGTYYLRLQAKDNQNNLSATSPELKAIIDTVAPTVTGSLSLADASDRSIPAYKASISWNTATDVTSGVYGYIVSKDGTALNLNPEGMTTSIQTNTIDNASSYLDDVLPNKKYTYAVKAIDLAKNESSLLSTNGGIIDIPTIITGEGTLEITDIKSNPSSLVGGKTTQATITWKTSVPSTSQVEYGISSDYNLKTELDTGLNTVHTVILNELAFTTTYHFKVISKDKNGKEVASADTTFTTFDLLKDATVLDTIIENLSGQLMKVRDIVGLLGSNITTTRSIATTSTAAVSVAAATAAAAPIANAITLFSIPEYIRALLFSLASLVTKRRKRSWGKIVEAGTNLPIEQAKVKLIKLEIPYAGAEPVEKLIQTTYTDRDGAYAFIADPGKYIIEVEKFSYHISPVTADAYHPGDTIIVKNESESLIVPSIVMSMKPEEARKKLQRIQKLEYLEKVLAYVSLAFLTFGTFSVLSALLKNHRDITSLIIAILYPFLWYLNIKALKKSSPFGEVEDMANKKGVPLALIRVMDKEGKRLIKTVITNENGKYKTLINKGKYKLLVAKEGYKQTDDKFINVDDKMKSLNQKIGMEKKG